MYNLIILPPVDELFRKMRKREKTTLDQIDKKIQQILDNPYAFKSLHAPMQNQRRVHIGSFVLIYEINEAEKTVLIVDYAHHDEAY